MNANAPAPPAPEKALIKTWGCQMNVYDSSRMTDILVTMGYALTDDPADADIVIFNTCHIREKASEKLFSELGRLREHKDARAARGQRTLIAVAGCVAQAVGDEIQRRAPFVDMVFGPQTYHRLPDMIAHAKSCASRLLDIEFPAIPKFDSLPRPAGSATVSAFLAIQEGCDRFCSYCVVPYTRGAQYSRPLNHILDEAQSLVDRGAREITVLGQNVNAWQDGTHTLAHLLERLALQPNVLRLRYMTSYPSDITDDLIAAHRDLPRVMPFLHLPAQSGSDAILAAMNRKHTSDDYRRIVERLRQARGDIALSSDFIVGFPGETDEDFKATLRLVHDIDYAQAFSFKYSRRPGTPAAALPDQIPETVKTSRLKELQALLSVQQERFNLQSLKRVVPVLVEGPARRKGFFFGRTPHMQTVVIQAPADCVGQVCNVMITSAGKNDLTGQVVQTRPADVP